MVDDINRFDIFLIKLDPANDSEDEAVPCIVLSPNEMNILKTVIVAPITEKGFDFIFRTSIKFSDKKGLIQLDQIRAVNKSRLLKKIGKAKSKKAIEISDILVDMFKL